MSNITLTSEAPTRLPSAARRPVPSTPLANLDSTSAVTDAAEATVTDLWIHLELRAPQRQLATCLSLLDQHRCDHSEARAEVVGVGIDGGDVRIIVGLNLGDSLQVKHRPAHVLAAYHFTQSLFESLFNFWPQYLHGTPTAEERAAAERLRALDAHDVAQETAVATSDAEDDLFADELDEFGLAPAWVA